MATYKVKLDDKEYEVSVTDTATGAQVTVEGQTFNVEPTLVRQAASTPTPKVAAAPTAPAAPAPAAPAPATAASSGGGSGTVNAPIPGVVTEVIVKVGDSVSAGTTLLKLEAMKMENDINAPIDGTIKEIAVSAGSEVLDGQLLLVIE